MRKPENLAGQKFGKLLAIREADRGKRKRTQWLCLCDCGKEKIAYASYLKNGQTKSCGCSSRERYYKSLLGKRFGKWTVISEVEKNKRRERCWLCRCDCGKEKVVPSRNLRYGESSSCGCSIQDKCNITYVGKIYGKLLVLSRDTKSRHVRFICQCECGNKKRIRACALIAGQTSCGCAHNYYGNKSHGWKGYGEISSSLFNRIKLGATKRGFSFDITIEYIWELFLKQNCKCAISGMDIDFGTRFLKSDCTASLDRIDSSLGYTKDNIQWTHKIINVMKMDLEEKQFFKFCSLITKHQESKQ